jgi:hypothetical protein
MVRLRIDQIEAAREWLETTDTGSAYIEGLSLILIGDVLKSKPEKIRSAIRSGDAILKRLAFVAAIRTPLDSCALQELVTMSHDKDISEFYEDYL